MNAYDILPFAAVAPGFNGGKAFATGIVGSAPQPLGNGSGRYMFTAYTSNVLIKFGTSTMTAATTPDGNWGMDIPAGMKGVIYIPDGITHFSVVADGAGICRWGKVGN